MSANLLSPVQVNKTFGVIGHHNEDGLHSFLAFDRKGDYLHH